MEESDLISDNKYKFRPCSQNTLVASRVPMKGPFLILPAFFFPEPMLRGVRADMPGGL